MRIIIETDKSDAFTVTSPAATVTATGLDGGPPPTNLLQTGGGDRLAAAQTGIDAGPVQDWLMQAIEGAAPAA